MSRLRAEKTALGNRLEEVDQEHRELTVVLEQETARLRSVRAFINDVIYMNPSCTGHERPLPASFGTCANKITLYDVLLYDVLLYDVPHLPGTPGFAFIHSLIPSYHHTVVPVHEYE